MRACAFSTIYSARLVVFAASGSLTMSYYLTLIGTRDNPLYETEITPKTASTSSTGSGIFSTSSNAGAAAGGSATESGSGSGMFGGLLSRIPTTGSALTGGSSATAGTSGSPAAAQAQSAAAAKRKQRYELQMIAHSALDTIEDALITSPYLYLKSIDRIQEYTTSCFVVPGNVKFVLLHEHKHEDGIKSFFLELWEAYLKVAMNPFQDANAPIDNPTFDARVRAAAKKFL
ncbi:hypothetical protein PANT_25d00034 [Moesziomyces antarcticus T-34]|uniref:Sedlin n=1 Tax=Pseudozyma antarctica (strain T-34) TaxID=1151754 RepID=M9M0U6_PSEA3|nr:hypothetical protein PANT_25d00034 [Moesziomyces antarcticus T-34]